MFHRSLYMLCFLCILLSVFVLVGCETARVLYDDAVNPPAETENGDIIVFEKIPNTEPNTYFCIFWQGENRRLITIWDSEKREHIAEATVRLTAVGILSKPKEKRITVTLMQTDLETFLSYDLTWETIVKKVIECETAIEENTVTSYAHAELQGGERGSETSPADFDGGGENTTDVNSEPETETEYEIVAGFHYHKKSDGTYVLHRDGEHDEVLGVGNLADCEIPDPHRGEGQLCPEVTP